MGVGGVGVTVKAAVVNAPVRLPTASMACVPTVIVAGIVMARLKLPLPSDVAVPNTVLAEQGPVEQSSVSWTVSVAPYPVPITVVVKPGGPRAGVSERVGVVVPDV